MNYRGSYRKLLANSKAAMLAAIEIYNKPLFPYRDECFCILLINAWELLAKAILSKNGQWIFYTKKEAGVAYRTYSLVDAMKKAKKYIPGCVSYVALRENIKHLTNYRDNAIHYYNEPGFGVVIFVLSQAAILTYRDLLLDIFDYDITNDVTIVLLPLSFGGTPDPVEFLRSKHTNVPRNKTVATFLKSVEQTTKMLEDQGHDTRRFVTRFDVNLASVKKISHADIVVGVDGALQGTGNNLIVEKNIDPNKKYPFKRNDVLEKIGETLSGVKFTTFTLDAIIYKHRVKKNEDYHWKALGGGAMQFSSEFLTFLRRLSDEEVASALTDYKRWRKEQRIKRIRKR